MSVGQVKDRPMFHMGESDSGDELPPISRFAVISLFLGLSSLLAILSSPLVPLAIVAMLASLVAVVRLMIDKTKGGIVAAQIGLGISMFSVALALTATWTRDSYLYDQGQQHAKTFLSILSAGRTFEAFELTRPEYERQIAGTDLAKYYEQIASMATPRPNGEATGNMPSAQSMEDTTTRDKLREFRDAATTAAIIEEGKDANWTLVKGNGVSGPSDALRVNVIMTNANNPNKKFNLLMMRMLRGSRADNSVVATWQIETVTSVK
jgi:hypothetical protein